ncbi:MAG: efflux RND transporter permease subunit [Pseudomonadales bacterium]|jgi:multidrug efflux pump|nr:efflux RND transporter permease subunit [Pseudomonadales bacterium]HJN49841.1 efflux RND transporter permease subunit [Pseudomonadales bacterium]|tara:strand:- start:149 stop:3331 length:3183 start_codon:yes stop_codon:yes gene_type:complete
MNYIKVAIDRSRTTLNILVVVLLAGIIAYNNIPLEANPDVSVPVVMIMIPHEGISPEDAERLLAKPMEIELRSIDGVDEISSHSGEGVARLSVEFDYDSDLDQALVDVREAVDKAKAKMPSTIEEPIIQEVVAAEFPIITVSLGGDGVPERVLYDHAMALRDELEGIPDVLTARLQGHREELLEAVINPAQLEQYGITNVELIRAVSNNNRLIAAGALDTGRGSFSVKVPGLIESRRDVLNLPLKATDDGVVTLSDVTRIRRTFKDVVNHTRANGAPAISLEISKRHGSNLIQVVDSVKAVVEREKASYPAAVEVSYIADQAPDTLDQINTLQGNISTAMFLVLTVVVAAVGLRSGMLVAIAVPVSFLFAFIVINALGYTYNFMVMFGMLLGLGMLIDGAIVVVEFADRKMAEGKTSREAYIYSIKRMFWPVVASTGTTLAAFLPLMFWPGVSGGFMRYLPVTVFAVLLGSLAYALVFAPVLGALFGKSSAEDEKTILYLNTLEHGDATTLGGITGAYARLLHFAVQHPFAIVALTVAVLYGIILLYLEQGRGMEFFTSVDPQFSGVTINARGNFSAEETRDIVVDVEQRIFGVGHVKSMYTRTGQRGLSFSPGGGGGSTGDTIGNLFIELTDRRDRDLNGVEIQELHRQQLRDIPGVRAEVVKQEMGPPVGKEVQIQLTGDDLAVLISEARRIRHYLEENVEGLFAIDDTTPVPGIEWQISVDRARAAMFGADITTVGTAVQLLTNGVMIGQYRPDDAEEEVDIRIRYPKDERGIHQLDQLRINTLQGLIPISSFVKREPKPQVTSINRVDARRVMLVRANTAEGVLADDKVKEISQWLESADLDPSLTVQFRGSNEEQAESMAFITQAFVLALLLMGILLVTQFNSFYQALLILSAVIMSTVGVLLGLVILDHTFSAIMTGVGVVALAGIIVNNNIVLIDTFNYLRREHPDWDLTDVIVRTGAQRLRPVFLTTFTTGFGLLPMASGVSVDLLAREVEIGGPIASFWVQLASAIVSGLTFATVLTLIVTPAMLMLPQSFAGIGRRLGALFKLRKTALDG